MACRALTSLTSYELSISAATLVPAAGEVPEHCRISGQILPEVRFELSLPEVWNGRLYMFGNGGFAGEALDAPVRLTRRHSALTHGFAVAQTNTGHDAAAEPLGSFAVNSQKLLDYAYRAVHVTALAAKRIAQSYYGQAARRSYFDGCSTGGRQGLMSAQRFPDDFDGIVVGAPVLDFSGTMSSYAWNQKALTAAPISPEKLKILADSVYAKCDRLDGLADGLIDDPRRCAFNAATDLPKCANDADGPACFSTSQIRTLELIYGGTQRKGQLFFPGQPLGAEIAAPAGAAGVRSGWIPWLIAPPNGRSTEANYGESFLRYMAFGRSDPNYDWTTFNFDADPDRMQVIREMLDATDADLSRFKARGGKIVMYYGWADPALNPLMGLRYYEDVAKRFGPASSEFFKLYMVPGMFHCNGGVGVSTFDALTPLVEWVEKGVAPQSILGSRVVDNRVTRTRPLCPYPQVAKYKGSGSIDDASNFACAAP
jgi:feruloyl esterase